MNYIIDGHNLIPNIPGLSLSDLDDEPRMIAIVREFCRLSRSHAELYFDGAPPVQKQSAGGGLVHVHFVRKGVPADEAIIRLMHQTGRGARNHTLVSSDHHIQSEARVLGIPIVESAAFARKMTQVITSASESVGKSEPDLSADEVRQWLEEFTTGHSQNS